MNSRDMQDKAEPPACPGNRAAPDRVFLLFLYKQHQKHTIYCVVSSIYTMHVVQHFLASAVLAWSVCSAAGPSTNFWAPLGCYASPESQALEIKKDVPLDKLKQSTCTDACAASNYTVAGLKAGTECWCGHGMPNKYADGIDCQTACSGDKYDDCGGKAAVFILVLYGSDVSTFTVASSAPTSTGSSSNSTAATTTHASDAAKTAQPAASSPSATQSGKSGASRGLDTATGAVMAGLLSLFAVFA